MRSLGRTIVGSLLMTGLAGSAGSTLPPSEEAVQRNFIWHAGDEQVKRLPHSVETSEVAQTVVDYQRDAEGTLLPDPRNPLDPADLVPVTFYKPAQGTSRTILLADCDSLQCRALPVGIRVDFFLSTCRDPAIPDDEGDDCRVGSPSGPPVGPIPGSGRSVGIPQPGEYNRLLDRGDDLVTDPLTGETGTVAELYVTPDGIDRVWQAGGTCPVTGRTGTCPDNRPTRLVVDREPGAPALDYLFEIPGADGELGPNPDHPGPLVCPDDVGELIVLLDEFRDRAGDGDPSNDPTEEDFKPLFRCLALECDDPAYNASRHESWQQPNPLRGRLTPTTIPETMLDWIPARDAGVRYHDLDVERGLFDPAADCDVGPCPYGPDPVDDRLLQLEQLTIAAEDLVLDYGIDLKLGQIDPALGDLGPYGIPPTAAADFDENYFFNTRFGGDFSGIVAAVEPEPLRTTNNRVNLVNFYYQLSGTLLQEDAIPYTNVKVAGGQSELPLRVAPDRSSLESPSPGLAQGLDFAMPEGVESYERNVDPSTGRPRKAGATGPCENAAGFLLDFDPPLQALLHAGNPRIEFTEGLDDPLLRAQVAPTGEYQPDYAYDDYHRRPEAYTHLGIGIDEACLKPGGAPQGPNENRFDPALAPDLEGFLGPYSSPDYTADPGSYIYQTLGQWGLEGSSVDYALAHHPANQGLFAWICSASLGAFVSLSPPSCLLDVFGSRARLIRSSVVDATFAEIVSTILAGEIHVEIQNIMALIQNRTKANRAAYQVAITPLNRDVRDGRTNAANVADKGVPNAFRDFVDWTTLDNSLTVVQKALLGCGPGHGTRCDMAEEHLVSAATFGTGLLGPGGGIDPLSAEASALLHAVPQGVGEVEDWVSWSSDPQPGTIDFEDGPFCTRHAPDSPFADEQGNVRLPGCRGALSVAINEVDNFVDVEFEPHYSSRQDGCFVGREIGGIPVRPVRRNPDTGQMEVDQALLDELNQTCFNMDGPLAPLENVVDQGRNISLVSDHRYALPDPDPDNPPVTGPYFSATQPFLGSRTIFHPFAGCDTAGPGLHGDQVFDGPDKGFLCDFRFRDYEQDFLDGSAQIFRSEMAAVSWNFLMFLVVTSCNTRVGDDLADPDCFDPAQAWALGRCSFSMPQLCRGAQLFLELAFDENRNGIPDNAEAVEIDIKPYDPHNRIRLGSPFPVGVAILGSQAVDVSAVEVASLAFGPGGAAPVHDPSSPLFGPSHLRDLNHDGYTDLLTHYDVEETGIVFGDVEACLTGEIDAEPFEACDEILVVWPSCGIGVELVWVLPLLIWLHRRRSS